MNPIEVVRRYNQAWNGRDANAIVQLFAEGGTYSNRGLSSKWTENRGKPARRSHFSYRTVSFLLQLPSTHPGQW